MPNTLAPDDAPDPVDREALQRAMAFACLDPQRRDQLLAMALEQPWQEVATFAAYCAQIASMHLHPWQDPPCLGIGTDPQPEAEKWADRLIMAGLSIYEPNPVEALAKARKAK